MQHIAETLISQRSGSGGIRLPLSDQSIFVAVRIQHRNPSQLAAGVGAVPAQEFVACSGGNHRMVHFLIQIIVESILPCILIVTLGHAAFIGIVNNRTVTGGSGIGVDTVEIHVDFHFSAGHISILGPLVHGIQQFVGIALLENDALHNAVAIHPAGACIIREHNQSIVLVLLQRQTIGRCKGIDLFIQSSQCLAQGEISLNFSDRMIIISLDDVTILIQIRTFLIELAI